MHRAYASLNNNDRNNNYDTKQQETTTTIRQDDQTAQSSPQTSLLGFGATNNMRKYASAEKSTSPIKQKRVVVVG